MINCINNISKHTYMPALTAPFCSSLSTRENIPKLAHVSIPHLAKISHFFSSSEKFLTHFLTLNFPSFLCVIAFHFAKIYNGIINCTCIWNSISITCANFDMFLCPHSPEKKRNWETILTLSSLHAILMLSNMDNSQAHLDTFH